ncbi:universal stress protein [Haladaptatus halobius]|uniref:universal stress protein n=1 Tax=Haladaptatus halobius TaxID=2884875 RepID=UPI001D0B3862|nr:universal stress protein [Haladaptatus halobius]
MERVLSVIEYNDRSKEMVREAGEIAAAIGAELVVLHVTSEEEFHDNQEQLNDSLASDTTMYSVEKAQEGAKQYAHDQSIELLGDLNVDVTPAGALGERRDEILSVANDHGCDFIFITGQKRSPTGKAIFGDDAQSIILNFDGSVVVRTK